MEEVNFNQEGQIYTTDSYVDWSALKSAVTATSVQLTDYSAETYDITGDWQTIEINAGSNVTLNTHGRRVFINIKGTSTAATVINILDSGTVTNFPKIDRFGWQRKTKAVYQSYLIFQMQVQ